MEAEGSLGVAAGSRDLPRESVVRQDGPVAAFDNERTWTAGMTQGQAPAELQAQLQRFRELKRTRRCALPCLSPGLHAAVSGSAG